MSSVADRRVSIVIISYNSNATLPRVFDCLAVQTFRDFDVIVIDNASRERPSALITGRPYPVSYMEMTDNLGFAGGMNAGLATCRSPYLVALNPDAFPEPTWLESLVAAADRFPDIAAFGSLQLSAEDAGAIDGFGDHYLITGQAWRGRTLPPPPPVQGPEYCFGVCAAAALYRAAALRDIGGFDERYFCFYEDVDVSFRLRLAGHQCAVMRTAVVHHVGGASFEGLSEFAERLTARNAWWTLVKNVPMPYLMFSATAFLVIQLVSLVKSRHRARWSGTWEGLKRTPEFFTSRTEVQSNRRRTGSELNQWLSWTPGAFLDKISITSEKS